MTRPLSSILHLPHLHWPSYLFPSKDSVTQRTKQAYDRISRECLATKRFFCHEGTLLDKICPYLSWASSLLSGVTKIIILIPEIFTLLSPFVRRTLSPLSFTVLSAFSGVALIHEIKSIWYTFKITRTDYQKIYSTYVALSPQDRELLPIHIKYMNKQDKQTLRDAYSLKGKPSKPGKHATEQMDQILLDSQALRKQSEGTEEIDEVLLRALEEDIIETRKKQLAAAIGNVGVDDLECSDISHIRTQLCKRWILHAINFTAIVLCCFGCLSLLFPVINIVSVPLLMLISTALFMAHDFFFNALMEKEGWGLEPIELIPKFIRVTIPHFWHITENKCNKVFQHVKNRYFPTK